jgi:hypothetical protein
MARSVIEKVLATIDAKIAALQLARAELLAQQQAKRRPRGDHNGNIQARRQPHSTAIPDE